VKIEDVIALIAQKIVPLKSLLESKEEERIAQVMSSFFDINEEGLRKITGSVLAPKSVMLPAADTTMPKSSKVGLTAAVVSPWAIVITKEKMGSSKPMVGEDRGKGPAKVEETKRL
jgi:hypothetical protein